MEEFSADIDVLTQILKEKYPNDDIIVRWHDKYCHEYYQLIQQHVWKPDALQSKYNDLKMENDDLKMEFNNLKTEFNKLKELSSKKCTSHQKPSTSNQGHNTSRQNRTSYTTIKTRIQESFSEDRKITGECACKVSSITECVETLKQLDKLVHSDKRTILLNTVYRGEVLKALKKLSSKTGSLINILADHGIKYSLTHCNFFIRFCDFAKQHKNIVKCSLSIEYIRKHFKQVKQIFIELGW